MKILIFSHEFPPQVGGAGVVAQEYAHCLSEAGHEVTVLTQDLGNSSTYDNFDIVRVKTIKSLWFFSYRKSINFKAFDLIILNDVGATYTAGLFFEDSLLAKSIVVLHGSEPERVFLKPSLKRQLTFFKKTYIRAINGARNIISVSHFMKGKFIKNTGLYDLESKIHVVHNFIDRDIFKPKSNLSFRTRLGLSEDVFLLVSASRLVFDKGYLEKINIFESLVDCSQKEFFWVIAGDGPNSNKIKEVVKNKGLDKRILFLGAVSRVELSEIFSSADLFWLLSNYEESLGLVYIEAQACGCPALGRNSSGVREAILDKKTGCLIDNDDDVKEFLLSKSSLDLFSKEAVEFLNNFDGRNLINFINGLKLK